MPLLKNTPILVAASRPDLCGAPPTRARFRVVGFCVALATITYLDRACIGVLSGAIREDLGLSMRQMSFVFSAFTLAYAIFEVPSAWWGGEIGPRRVLARIVAWWSAFTLLTAAATGYAMLLVVRFLFGAGEAGAWPNATRVFSRWIPTEERGRVQGVFFAGAHAAAGLTPPLVLLMVPVLGWRGVFVVFGLLGFIWSIAWLRWFRDQPGEHPEVNAGELAHIQSDSIADAEVAPGPAAVPRPVWRAIFSSRAVWLLCLVAFANGYGFYFIITWLPTFLGTLGFEKTSLAWYAGLPMLFAVPADLLGGVATDYLSRKLGLRLGRALVGGAAYALAAAAMFAATTVANTHLTALLLAVAGGASMFALAASWAACIEIGGAHAGVVSATMNTVGQIGGMLSPVVLAWLVERSGDAGRWFLPLQLIAGCYLAAALSWLFIDPRKRLSP
jgi:ACS family glucarate transporter-like MFS transporter